MIAQQELQDIFIFFMHDCISYSKWKIVTRNFAAKEFTIKYIF